MTSLPGQQALGNSKGVGPLLHCTEGRDSVERSSALSARPTGIITTGRLESREGQSSKRKAGTKETAEKQKSFAFLKIPNLCQFIFILNFTANYPYLIVIQSIHVSKHYNIPHKTI